MTNLRTAAQQALEALEEYQSNGAPFLACDGAIDALRAALAQQADKQQRPKCLEFALDFLGTPENGELRAYIEQLEARAALAQQDEPVWMHPWPPVRAQQAEPQTIDEAMSLPRALAQAYESGHKAGAAAEREECAKLCEARFVGDLNREDMEARRCAAAIRARGEQP